MKPEAAVQKAILDYLTLVLRVPAFRRNVGAAMVRNAKGPDRFVRFSQKGQSDVFGWLPNGVHYEIEMKAPKKKPTQDQFDWLVMVSRSGAHACWADSLPMAIRHIKEWYEAEGIAWRREYDQ